MAKTYVVLEEIRGVSKKGNPYHMVKFADTQTFENHVLSVDENSIKEELGLKHGQKVVIDLDLRTDFRGTNAVITSIKAV
ncbi:MAG TPA: hypothetical protein VNS08_17265 [Ureibacillus sp.]|nr:hypothetical protein [Ureibacillus sp.]